MTPAPKNVLGVLCPNSGDWWIVLAFSDIGYVKDPAREVADEAGNLKALLERAQFENKDRMKQGAAPIASLEWESRPTFDDAAKTVEWALRATTQPKKGHSETVVNQTFRVLCRHGALDAVTARAYRGFKDLAPLKELMKGLTVKEEESYASYHEGDKLFASNPGQLFRGDIVST